MANSESLRDVASFSALGAVAISSSYFYSEISNMKEEVQEIKKNLAAIIPLINPDSGKQLNCTVDAIKLLDSRLAKTQDDIRIISEHTPGLEDKQKSNRVYKRLTQRGADDIPEQPTYRPKPKFKARTIAPQIELDEEDTELDDDIAAMMG
ncbi:hypothetical protein BH23THE1_BH23THE1_29920 [soil metagenome]